MSIAVSIEPTPTAPDQRRSSETSDTENVAVVATIDVSEPMTDLASLQQPDTATPPPRSTFRAGIQHSWQTWNNCGPATLTMNMSYYGAALDQGAVGAALRQNPDDKNVGPAELAAYARSQGFQAEVHVNGTDEELRRLLDAGIPVLIETWLDPADAGGLGHYRLLVGYDDANDNWIAYDSFVGESLVNPDGPYEGISIDYAETESLWKVFNRTFVLIHVGEDIAEVESILGPSAANDMMWEEAIKRAQSEIEERPDDAYAWFNLGSSQTALGRFQEAVTAFDRAREIGLPWRMLWYQHGPFEAYYTVGRHQDVLELADNTLSTEVQIEEIYFWLGQSLRAIGDEDGAQRAWQAANRLNPTFVAQMGVLPAGEN